MSPLPQPQENLKILIVDDNLSARQAIALCMRTKQISTVDMAENGKKAREMIDTAQILGKPYHIVFLDWEMPVMPGIEVLSFFRAQSEFANTAFVMVTAVSVQSKVLEAIKIGATAYMIKPLSQAAINKKFDEIVAWLRQRKAI